MRNKRNAIKVKKLELPPSANLPVSVGGFDSMPQLYLDLLENKSKVKQELVNKVYEPTIKPIQASHSPKQDFAVPMSKRLRQLINERKDNRREDLSGSDTDSESTYDQSSNISGRSDSEDEISVSEDAHSGMEDSYASSSRSIREEYHTHTQQPPREDTPIYREQRSPQERFAKIYSPQRPQPVHPRDGLPPSLNELNAVPAKVVPKIDDIREDEDMENKKRDLLRRLGKIRSEYPDVEIPEYSIHSDYKAMKRTYDAIHRNIQVDMDVHQYKMYLNFGFGLIEIVLGKWLGLPASGLANAQARNMAKYERLLIELGEKSYVDEESQLPVELRLLWLMTTQSCMFIGMKALSKKLSGGAGNSMNDLMNTMYNNMQPQKPQPTFQGFQQQPAYNHPPQPTSVPPRKRKMGAPKVNIDELLDLSKD